MVGLFGIMPTISAFYGIVIKMFFNDHAPPHFHAEYAEFKATVDIGSLRVLEGQLPRFAYFPRTPLLKSYSGSMSGRFLNLSFTGYANTHTPFALIS